MDIKFGIRITFYDFGAQVLFQDGGEIHNLDFNCYLRNAGDKIVIEASEQK